MNHGKNFSIALNDNGRIMFDHDFSLILPALIKWMSELIRKRGGNRPEEPIRDDHSMLSLRRCAAAVLSLVNHCPATSKQNKKPETRSKNPGRRSQRLFDD